ncbi:MAG: hypothetical protein AAF802_11765 [Planctomycetota bacterium]
MIDAQTLVADLVIGSPSWTIPAIGIGTLLTFLVLWNDVRSRNGAPRTSASIIAVLLKLMGIALLAVCLIQPMRRDERPRPRANLLPILVDTSGSMGLRLGQESESWRSRIDQTLRADSPAMAAMSETFETRLYGFDRRLSSAANVADLPRDANASRLAENLMELERRLGERPVAGVLLLTDGNDSGAISFDDAAGLSVPVFPVIPTQTSGWNDLKIDSVTVRQTNFEIAPVTISASFSVTGNMSGEATARLVAISRDDVVEQKKVTLRTGQGEYNVKFELRPKEAGLTFYRLDVFRESDRAAFDSIEELNEQASTETTLINNTRLIEVDRRAGPYRVLYFAGRPNWEYKFLRRAVAEDAEVELTALLRMANKEPKFSFRDKAVTGTNPLFQGLGNDAEETAEQYDEPVMIRLGVRRAEELASGFPTSADELFEYDALILDDVEPAFFTQDQLNLIRRFVSVRGGGFLMLGGQEMYRGRDFSESPLGELSPVYLPRAFDELSGPYRISLTREGMLQPWMRLRKTADEEQRREREMLSFTSANNFGGLKPGAYPLATLQASDGEEHVAIAMQRYGAGKVGSLAIADLWRWSTRAVGWGTNENDDPAQFWRQLTRWLVSDVPRRAELTLEVEDGKVDLRVLARDRSYSPIDNADVQFKVERPNGESLTLNAKPSDEEAGVYFATFFDSAPGPYTVTAEVAAMDGEMIGTPESGWTNQIAGREYDKLGVNRDRLLAIAKQTGGSTIPERSLASIVDRMDPSRVPVTEVWSYPLWHRGWVIALALACFAGEWGLRRWKGMA